MKAAPAMQRNELCSGRDTTSVEAEGKEMGVVRRFIYHKKRALGFKAVIRDGFNFL